DPSMNGPSDARGDLIILAARDQRGDLDRRKLIRDIPVPEGTLDRELAGSPHRPIDGYADFAQRPGQLARPGPKAADVAAVERHRGRGIRRIVEGLPALQPIDRPLDRNRQRSHETPQFHVRDGHTREPARDDQASEVPLVLDRIREREHPAVTVPEQVDSTESRGLSDALDFLDAALDREERRPSRPFARADPELIVEDDPIAERGEIREACEVSMRHARASMEAQDRAAVRGAEGFPEQAITEDGDLSLRGRSRFPHGPGHTHPRRGAILFRGLRRTHLIANRRRAAMPPRASSFCPASWCRLTRTTVPRADSTILMTSSIPGFRTTASLTRRVSIAPASAASCTSAGP